MNQIDMMDIMDTIDMIDVVDIDIIAMTSIPPNPRSNEKNIYVNYYPTACIESKRNKNGTSSYIFEGRVNEPNIIYFHPGETAPSGRNYCTKQLYLIPNKNGFQEFPFLGKASEAASADGAIIIYHESATNVMPLFTVFFLKGTDAATAGAAASQIDANMDDRRSVVFGRNAGETNEREFQRSLEHLFDNATNNESKKWIQHAPHLISLNDNLDRINATFDIKHVTIGGLNRYPCIVAISSSVIPIQSKYFKNRAKKVCKNMVKKNKAPSVKYDDAKIQEGFDASSNYTGNIGQDVAYIFKNAFSSNQNVDGSTVPMGSIRVPLNDDPNYTYQECTMVPVDDINMQDTEYVYQVAGNSTMIANKTVTIQGNLLTYLIIYFSIFLLTYFGAPFLYAFLMCSILKRGYNYTGFSALIDYLKRPQNFLGFGKFTGVAVIFNVIFFVTLLLVLTFGTITTSTWLIITWIVGYMGISNNPVPERCMLN